MLHFIHSLKRRKQLSNGSVQKVPDNGEDKAVHQSRNPSGRAKRKPNKNTGGQRGEKESHHNKHQNRHFIG